MVVNISVLFISGEYKVVSNSNVFFHVRGGKLAKANKSS